MDDSAPPAPPADQPPARRGPGCLAWMLGGAILMVIGAWALGAFASVKSLDRLDGLFTAKLPVSRIAYGPDPAQRLYVHGHKLASGQVAQPLKPVLIFVHGGSWHSGDPAEYGFIARNFAPHGYVVVNSGYRLGRSGRFPAMVEDTAAALAWVRANIAAYGGDNGRILLMGHSAGAYNVVMVASDPRWLAPHGLDPGMISGVVGLAGPYDFLPFDHDSTRAAFGHAALPASTQPVTYASAMAPPMLLLTGGADTRVKPRNSLAMAKALTDAGAEARAVVIEDIGHIGVLTALARPFDHDRRVKQTVLDFLARHAKAPPASAPVQGGKG